MHRALCVVVFAFSACNFDKAFADRCEKTRNGLPGGFDGGTDCNVAPVGGGTGGGGEPMGGGIGPLEPDPRSYGCTPLFTTATRTNFGATEWTVENPMNNTPNAIYALWGGIDPGGSPSVPTLWFGGAGGVLGRLGPNRTGSDESWRLPSSVTGDQWEPAPAIIGVGTTTEGVYLLEEGRGLAMLPCNINAVAFSWLDAGRPDAITTHNDTLYLLSSATGVVTTLDGGSVFPASALVRNMVSIDSFYVDNQWCLVTGRNATHTVLVDCKNNRELPLNSGERAYSIRRLLDGRVAVAGSGEVLFPQLDGSLARESYSYVSEWADLVLTDSSPWAVTNQAGRIELQSGGVNASDLPGGAWTSWSSPFGTPFVAGKHGSVSSFSSTVGPSSFLPVTSQGIRGLFIGDAGALAVGSGVYLSRTSSGEWVDLAVDDQHSWTSVARDSAGWVYLTDESSVIYGIAPSSTTPSVLRQGVSRKSPYDARSAESILLQNGEVMLALGPQLIRASTGVLSTELDVSDAGIDRIVAVAETPEHDLWFVAQTSGTLAKVMVFHGDGGVLTASNASTEALDVSACGDGTVLISGSHGLIRRGGEDAGVAAFGANFINVPTTLDLPSVWCDGANKAWAITDTGLVAQFDSSGVPTVQRTGWGKRKGPSTLATTIEPSFIRGTPTMIFISGESGAILTRSH
ncbi:MAG: hypothetical protein QM817_23825 [Archangium sp.]